MNDVWDAVTAASVDAGGLLTAIVQAAQADLAIEAAIVELGCSLSELQAAEVTVEAPVVLYGVRAPDTTASPTTVEPATTTIPASAEADDMEAYGVTTPTTTREIPLLHGMDFVNLQSLAVPVAMAGVLFLA